VCRKVSGWCLKLHCCTRGLVRTSAGSTPYKGTTSPIPIEPLLFLLLLLFDVILKFFKYGSKRSSEVKLLILVLCFIVTWNFWLLTERYFSTVVHTNEGMDTSQTIGSGGSGSNGSHGSSGGTQTPPSRTPNPGGSAPAGAPPTSSAKSQSS